MRRQTECIERLIQRAEADEPVYITDVREAFDRCGERVICKIKWNDFKDL